MGLSWVHIHIKVLPPPPPPPPPPCAPFRHRVIHDREVSRVNFPYICYMTPTSNLCKPLPYCMHYVTCVKCNQEILVFHSSLTFKAGNSREAGSVVTGGTVGWHNDNFWCRHWRRDWHRGSSEFSVFVHLFKWLFMFTSKSYRVSSYILLNISRGMYSPTNSDETPHGSPIRTGYGVSFVSS